jgi:hypothetical protein
MNKTKEKVYLDYREASNSDICGGNSRTEVGVVGSTTPTSVLEFPQ